MATRAFIQYVIVVAIFALLNSSFTLPAVAPGPYKMFVFEGSDWCTNCKRLEKTVLTDAAFAGFLQDQHIELERIDFPQQKKLPEATEKHNDELATKFSFDGVFPSVFLVNPETGAKQRLTYNNQNADEFMALVKNKLESLK